MATPLSPRPWEQLSELIGRNDAIGLETYLDELAPDEKALGVSRLDDAEREALLGLLPAAQAASLLVDLPDDQATDLVVEIPAADAAEIVDLMPADEQADLLGGVRASDAEAILAAMPAEDANTARRLLQYPEDTAGGLMSLEYLSFPEASSVSEVVHDLRLHAEAYSDYEVQYGYVVSPGDCLVGVLRMRDLLLAAGHTPIRELMIADPVRVSAHAPLEDLIALYEAHSAFLGIPVTDDENRLIGVVERDCVTEAAGRRVERSFLRISGIIGGEEFRSMPLAHRSFRRLAWLAPNIVLNIIAASVIAMYQDTLQAVIALAVFLPIISDMSGCSGNQAVAVSIRELSLGLIDPHEFLRVFSKEAGVGLINGCILGSVLGAIAALWQGSPYLGLVVGASLALNTLLSVILGGSVPLLLRRFDVDPALASGPILTTVTDMCGFFLVLSFASAMLSVL